MAWYKSYMRWLRRSLRNVLFGKLLLSATEASRPDANKSKAIKSNETTSTPPLENSLSPPSDSTLSPPPPPHPEEASDPLPLYPENTGQAPSEEIYQLPPLEETQQTPPPETTDLLPLPSTEETRPTDTTASAPQPPAATMTTEHHLQSIVSQLSSTPASSPQTSTLLSKAKICLLKLNALIPRPSTPPHLLTLARQTLETGALISIRLQDPSAFTRYFLQLQAFYELPTSSYSSKDGGQRSKITGLYLLLLLTKGDYAGFHTLLEGLEVEAQGQGLDMGGDRFLQYPVMLEQWLMEGAYDRVWGATKRDEVPSEEFAVFSEVLVGTIRSEIASCSEKAYPSLPIANAKNLLFLDSEGSVMEFAHQRGWVVRDGRIWFPLQAGEMGEEKEILVASGQVIENAIGYARELETIV